MPGPIPIVAPEIAAYLGRFRRPRAGVLARLEEEARREGVPIVPPETAAFLELLVRILTPERILEIGTAIGYSAIVMGEALPPWSSIDTIELDPATGVRAQENVAAAGLSKKITVWRGSALQIMPMLQNRYELVFIDAAKEEYAAYLHQALPLMPQGATVVVDNLLWGGRAAVGAEADPFYEKTTPHVQRFNEAFLAHPQLRAEILPVGDGLGIAVKL